MVYLAQVDSPVDEPRGLEVFFHSRLERFGHVMSAEEVLEVTCLRVVVEATRVHSLNDRRDVTEHDGVH